MSLEQIAASRCFNGQQLRFRHQAQSLNCEMNFSVFLPPQAEQALVPALYWLSGLTCTDENFVIKAGAQRAAAEHGIALIAPDTSPRGDDVPDDPDASYDMGLGAGFYVNATQSPWDRHYRMYDYVADELPRMVAQNLSVAGDRAGIFGHSMGGHGALTIGLKHPDRYRSISAFAPICSPLNCPWGEKALNHYLGSDRSAWNNYDACSLISAATTQRPLLVDQGGADQFLTEQLKPELLEAACKAADYPAQIRMQPGYDHSYYFIASFIDQHLAFHAQHL